MIWRVILYCWLGANLALANLPLQSGAWLKTNETRSLYDRMLVIRERDTNNNPLVTYTRGLDLSLTLQGAGGIGGLLARTDTNGSTFYHCDGSGNVTSLIDENQNIVARYEYDAFGKLIGKWGTYADVNTYRFSSKEFQRNSGLYAYGFRFYEPNFQRWMNRDPIGIAGGRNLYRFNRNSPVNLIDRHGLVAAGVAAAETGVGNGVTAAEMAQAEADGTQAIAEGDELLAAEAGGGSVLEFVPPALAVAATAYGGYELGNYIGDKTGFQDAIANALGPKYDPSPLPLPDGWTGTGGQYKDTTDGTTRNADGSLAKDASGRTVGKTCPDKAKKVLDNVDQNGSAPPGHKGGRDFQNDGRGGGQVLPQVDIEGNPISYQEWDVNPYTPGENRGPERLVTGDDGSAYYTSDHYQTFTKIR